MYCLASSQNVVLASSNASSASDKASSAARTRASAGLDRVGHVVTGVVPPQAAAGAGANLPRRRRSASCRVVMSSSSGCLGARGPSLDLDSGARHARTSHSSMHFRTPSAKPLAARSTPLASSRTLRAALQDGEVLLEEHFVALDGVLGEVGEVSSTSARSSGCYAEAGDRSSSCSLMSSSASSAAPASSALRRSQSDSADRDRRARPASAGHSRRRRAQERRWVATPQTGRGMEVPFDRFTPVPSLAATGCGRRSRSRRSMDIAPMPIQRIRSHAQRFGSRSPEADEDLHDPHRHPEPPQRARSSAERPSDEHDGAHDDQVPADRIARPTKVWNGSRNARMPAMTKSTPATACSHLQPGGVRARGSRRRRRGGAPGDDEPDQGDGGRLDGEDASSMTSQRILAPRCHPPEPGIGTGSTKTSTVAVVIPRPFQRHARGGRSSWPA